MVHYRSGTGYFLFFYLTLQFANLASLHLCQFLGATSKNLQVALTVFPLLMFFSIAFSGFVVQLPSLPVYLKGWAPAISIMRWAFQAVLVNELDENPKAFPHDETEGWISYFEMFGFGSFSKWAAVFILLSIALCFR
eukprot:CAMPEP_0117811108 /NCGR_PEP_ID=MMETSP0948-20121206/21917_1 /TAXON_ID=44440 /ORGANISM="Chattonella subsalsa, Strain CCMP2191" /LENGTH=136 /DNA_ID=CAMNT_0005647611 /DNA_START=286 /DNA_END=692 /DNA_ORIENTATION=+